MPPRANEELWRSFLVIVVAAAAAPAVAAANVLTAAAVEAEKAARPSLNDIEIYEKAAAQAEFYTLLRDQYSARSPATHAERTKGKVASPSPSLPPHCLRAASLLPPCCLPAAPVLLLPFLFYSNLCLVSLSVLNAGNVQILLWDHDDQLDKTPDALGLVPACAYDSECGECNESSEHSATQQAQSYSNRPGRC
jgi:hypothetical protein